MCFRLLNLPYRIPEDREWLHQHTSHSQSSSICLFSQPPECLECHKCYCYCVCGCPNRIWYSCKHHWKNMSIHFKTVWNADSAPNAYSFFDDDCNHRSCRNSNLYPKKRHIHLVLFIGYASHPLLDTATVNGVKLFYPFSKVKMRFSDGNESSHSYRLQTGK